MNKKILILYTNYGTGHYQAAKAIEEYINDNFPKYQTLILDPLTFSRPIINKLFAKIGKIVATKFRNFRKKLYQKKCIKIILKTQVFSFFALSYFGQKN